jgi:hypothetical protein
MPLWHTITDPLADRPTLERRRYGVIEARGGRLVAIHLRPYPLLLSRRELWLTSDNHAAAGPPDTCRLYYNQPLRASRYLALKYIETTAYTSYATFRAALTTLDWLAELKASDALVCEAANERISVRLLERFGWQPHAERVRGRNYIKRFYGVYPGVTLLGELQSRL